MRCASCDREMPDDGIICPHCNDAAPEPAAGYRDLRREARSLRGWLILSLVFGIVSAPFAIWRATTALARFRGKAAEEDPVSYRQLRVMRRLAVALLALWALLLAAQFGLTWEVAEPKEAMLLDAVVDDMLIECACPADTIYLLGSAAQDGTFEYLARGRKVAGRGEPMLIDLGVTVRLGTPQYFGEDKAAVAAQLDTPYPLKSFGANYMLRREPDGRWKVYDREIAWKS